MLDPVKEFVSSRTVALKGAETNLDDLHQAYNSWCVANGHDFGVSSLPIFARRLNAALPAGATPQRRMSYGRRYRLVTGLQLIPEEP